MKTTTDCAASRRDATYTTLADGSWGLRAMKAMHNWFAIVTFGRRIGRAEPFSTLAAARAYHAGLHHEWDCKVAGGWPYSEAEVLVNEYTTREAARAAAMNDDRGTPCYVATHSALSPTMGRP